MTNENPSRTLSTSNSMDAGSRSEVDDISSDVLNDLEAAASVSDVNARQIAQELRQTEGMLTGYQVHRVTKEVLGPDAAETAAAVARLIVNISEEMKPDLLNTLDQWCNSAASRQERFSTDILNAIRRNLDILIHDDKGSRLLHKAQRLQRETGNELYTVLCVCDVRPVFDDEHMSVEGFITLVNFQLGYKKQNQQADFLELTLTEDELQLIVDKANDALQKLRVLEDSMQDVGISEEGS